VRTFVVDASVALAWLLDERRPGWVDDLLIQIADGSVRPLVHDLFWLEVGNALARHRGLSDEQAMEGILRLEALGLETIRIDAPLRLRALQLARDTGLTVYDASYLALADATDAQLATLDARLEKAAASDGRRAGDGPRRVSDGDAAYGAPAPDAVSLARLGATLSELRRRYASA
jgi:predicted nucleic acid-binding protein